MIRCWLCLVSGYAVAVVFGVGWFAVVVSVALFVCGWVCGWVRAVLRDLFGLLVCVWCWVADVIGLVWVIGL